MCVAGCRRAGKYLLPSQQASPGFWQGNAKIRRNSMARKIDEESPTEDGLRMARLHSMIAAALKARPDAVIRLAEVPGLGVDSAQPIIAEVGA